MIKSIPHLESYQYEMLTSHLSFLKPRDFGTRLPNYYIWAPVQNVINDNVLSEVLLLTKREFVNK